MPPASEQTLPWRSPFRVRAARDRPAAHERPTLGSMPESRRGHGAWLLVGIDLLSSAVVLASVLALSGAGAIPAILVAPLIFVGLQWACGAYRDGGAQAIQHARDATLMRLLAAAVLAWVAAMLAERPVTVAEQLSIWAGTAVVSAAGGLVAAPVIARLRRPERWVLIGDPDTAERLQAYAPLAEHATIVSSMTLAQSSFDGVPSRSDALQIVDRHGADRVVIASRSHDDSSLVGLIRTFQAVGVPVSLLPRPLDLLETPAKQHSQVGGLPLLEVSAGQARAAVPYKGPDRRRKRKTKVSVVVPAMNEEGNIGAVLERLPEDLHEVILVDGNSRDRTIEVATTVRPDIRVLTQSGRGKGDALRTGFSAVTGNLIVMLDADGSAAPEEIPRFVEALEEDADFAKGSRFLEGGGSADITLLRRAGNAGLNISANLLHGTRFTDLCYGYNAFWARCLPFISLDVPGFEVETLINLRMAAAGMRIREVPSYEASRVHGTSNLNTFRDGYRVLRIILRESKLNVFRWPRQSEEKAAPAAAS